VRGCRNGVRRWRAEWFCFCSSGETVILFLISIVCCVLQQRRWGPGLEVGRRMLLLLLRVVSDAEGSNKLNSPTSNTCTRRLRKMHRVALVTVPVRPIVGSKKLYGQCDHSFQRSVSHEAWVFVHSGTSGFRIHQNHPHAR
jgi:hypothetical protein